MAHHWLDPMVVTTAPALDLVIGRARRERRDRGDRRHVVLFYAAHDETRIVFRNELEALRETLNLEVVHVFEQPRADWPGERGQITVDLLRRHLPRQFRQYGYFVCGPPPMMDAVEDTLVNLGVSRGFIDTERFHVV